MNSRFVSAFISGLLFLLSFAPSAYAKTIAQCQADLTSCLFNNGGAMSDQAKEVCKTSYDICSSNATPEQPAQDPGTQPAPAGDPNAGASGPSGSSGGLNLIPTQLGESAGYQTQGGGSSITIIVLKIIRGFMGLLGIVAVVLIVYAGFLWMTAGGEEEKVKQSKKILVQAVIGMAIILLAFAISSFVINALVTATTGEASATVGGF